MNSFSFDNEHKIFLMASRGELDALKETIELDPELLSKRAGNGNSMLMFAAENGHLDTVQWLLQNGASLSEKNNNGSTAFLFAAFNGHLTTVQWLLQNGASLSEKNNYGNTALLIAALNGHLTTVQWLLQNGASLSEKNNDGNTALLIAALNGHLTTVQWLLQNGASLSEKNNNGSTAFLFAALNGHLDTVQWLLQNGASLSEKNNDGNTALLIAALNGQLTTLQWLLQNGASLSEKNNNGSTAFLFAALNGHLDTVQWLLQNGASLSEKNNYGNTALLIAALNGQLTTLQWLLQNGASLSEKDNDGNTALLFAAENGHLDTVQWLLQNGASLSEKDNDGNTALLIAAHKGHHKLVSYLLDQGAIVDDSILNNSIARGHLLQALNMNTTFAGFAMTQVSKFTETEQMQLHTILMRNQKIISLHAKLSLLIEKETQGRKNTPYTQMNELLFKLQSLLVDEGVEQVTQVSLLKQQISLIQQELQPLVNTGIARQDEISNKRSDKMNGLLSELQLEISKAGLKDVIQIRDIQRRLIDMYLANSQEVDALEWLKGSPEDLFAPKERHEKLFQIVCALRAKQQFEKADELLEQMDERLLQEIIEKFPEKRSATSLASFLTFFGTRPALAARQEQHAPAAGIRN